MTARSDDRVKRGDSQSDNGASEVVCISASCCNTEWDNNHNNKDEDEIKCTQECNQRRCKGGAELSLISHI